MNRQRGFSLVELVVVVVVIAILTTIVTLGLSRYQAQARDARRLSNAIAISENLEKYFDTHGEYPNCAAITAPASTVTSTTLVGIDLSALRVPDAAPGTTNSIQCGTSLSLTGQDFIQYVGDGSADCNGSGSCLSFSLRYRDEIKNTIDEIKSRRTTNIATSGFIKDLVATVGGFKAINLTWGSIQNSTSYSLQYATDINFTNNLVNLTAATNSASVTNLTPGTSYYFRVAAANNGQPGPWSNVAQATTLKLGAPILTTNTDSTTQITASWTVSANADAGTTYTLQRASDNGFTTNLVTVSGNTSRNVVASGLSVGQTYYFRVQATTADDTSNWSSTIAATTVPNPPTNVTATVNSSTQVTISWTAASGATGYTVSYGISSSANDSTVTTTGTSRAVAGLAQGTLYYFKVYSTVSGATSAASNTVSATTPIDPPTGVSISGSISGTAYTATASANCPGGTTPTYRWTLNGGSWVSGTGYRSVTAYGSYGGNIQMTLAVACLTSVQTSGYTNSSNSVNDTFPVPAPQFTSFTVSGRHDWLTWTGPDCGTYYVAGYEGGYSDNPYIYSGTAHNYDEDWYSPGYVYYQIWTICNGVTSPRGTSQTNYVNGYPN